MNTKKQIVIPAAKNAILTLAKIKAALASFDRGDSNAFDALDAIVVAVEAHRSANGYRREAA